MDYDEISVIVGIFDIVKNLEKAYDIYCCDLYFNYYEDIHNFTELQYALLDDETLWLDEDYDRMMYERLANIDDEEDAKVFLMGMGWQISSTGLAIGLMEEVKDIKETA